MAIYSLHVKTVSRSAGRSVVAAAAYRAAETIADERLGVVWDFTRKYGVLHSEIVAPADAPEWARDRGELWNAAERAEDNSTRRQSATTGRDIILALPHELSDAQRLAAVQEFAAGLVECYGVAVDFAIHAPDRHSDERNYHAHVLMTTRRIGADGFGAKTRELDSFRTGPREIEAIRQEWERIGNRALEQAGIEERIDCRSYADRGIDREATVHLGPVAAGMERGCEGSDLGDRNRAAQARNAEREQIAGERAAVSAEIIDLAAERERRAQENELRGAIRSGSPPRILEALTERRSTFSRGDLNRALAKVIVDPAQRASFTDRILALPDVVGLKETETAPVSRYTTRAVIAAEARVMRDASALAGESRHGLTGAEREAALDRHKQVTGERRAAFRELTQAKGMAVLAGEAGTGKSTTLAAVRDAYESAGYRVIGMSWTNQVVQNLQRDGFRDATTVAAELYRLDRGTARWDRRTVLVVDEAGMLSTKHLAHVMEEARAAGAKLVLAGDDKQLASIERGGLFGALREKHGGPELHDVVRVSDAEQRRAFNLMHQGQFLPALAIYARQGAIHWSGGQDEARAALVRAVGQGHCGRSGQGPLCLRLHQRRRPRAQCRLARNTQGAGGARRRSPAQDGGRRRPLCRRRPDPVYRHRGAPRGPASRDRQWRCRHHPRDRGRPGHRRTRRQARSTGAPRLLCRRRRLRREANSTSSGTAMPGRSTRGRGARSTRPTSITARTGALPRAMWR